MHEYRLNFFDADGRRQGIELIHAEDDGAALDRARIRFHAHSIDVACGDRKVGTVTPSDG